LTCPPGRGHLNQLIELLHLGTDDRLIRGGKSGSAFQLLLQQQSGSNLSISEYIKKIRNISKGLANTLLATAKFFMLKKVLKKTVQYKKNECNKFLSGLYIKNIPSSFQ
jgi:hypothetical protein